MKCTHCNKKLTTNEVSLILLDRIKCSSCNKYISFESFQYDYLPGLWLWEYTSGEDFIEMITDLLNIGIFRKDEKGWINLYNCDSIDTDLLWSIPVDEAMQRVRLAGLIVKGILKKYFAKNDYFPWVFQLSVVAAELDFVEYCVAIQKCDNLDKITLGEHIKALEISVNNFHVSLKWWETQQSLHGAWFCCNLALAENYMYVYERIWHIIWRWFGTTPGLINRHNLNIMGVSIKNYQDQIEIMKKQHIAPKKFWKFW